MQTIVELPEYLRRSAKLLSVEERERERESIVNYLASHPASGDLIKGTGGIRKLRWSAHGKGKSGGVRIIFYHHNESIPLFLLTVFAKGEKTNISKSEGNELAKLTSLLVKNYGGPK